MLRLGKEPFVLLALPYDKLNRAKYVGRLRPDPKTGAPSGIAVAMDFARRRGSSTARRTSGP